MTISRVLVPKSYSRSLLLHGCLALFLADNATLSSKSSFEHLKCDRGHSFDDTWSVSEDSGAN
jgi:hypothetical protein